MAKYVTAQGGGPALVPASAVTDQIPYGMIEQRPDGSAVYTSTTNVPGIPGENHQVGYAPAQSVNPIPAGRGRA